MSTAEDPVLGQFQQMWLMISSFLGSCQDTTPRQSFCNYLHSKTECLERREFLTCRNETVKLLSGIQYKAKERKRQITTSQQVTTFQLPEAKQAIAGLEYILTIPDTQPVSTPVVQSTQIAAPQSATVIAKVQQPQWSLSTSSQAASYIVEDDQQPGPSTATDVCFEPNKDI